MFETDKNSYIKKLVFVQTKLVQDSSLRCEREGRRGRDKIERGDEFVNTGVEESIGRSKNRVDIRLWVSLQVYQLLVKEEDR